MTQVYRGMILLAGLTLATCATLEREPSEDELGAAFVAKFRNLQEFAAFLPGIKGVIDLQAVKKQSCQATDDVRRSGYRCTVTLDVKTPLTILHPTLDLRFIKTASGWAVADFL